MTGKAKKIFLGFVAVALLGASAGYYLWNKPHQDITGADAKKVSATILYKTFITDSSAAKKDYLLQVLQVNGVVGGVSKNQQQQTVITIRTGSEGAYINCTMEGGATAIKEGMEISLKGICKGLGQGDADLGIMGDVYVVRCYAVK